MVENIHNGETFVIKVCHCLLGSQERSEWVPGKEESLELFSPPSSPPC